MLKEVKKVSQPEDGHRRWFNDHYFDLIVWDDLKTGDITGFELCYDCAGNERALTWDINQGFSHTQVDGGESTPMKNMAPIFLPDGSFPYQEVAERFTKAAAGIDADLAKLVSEKLKEFSG